MTTRSSGILLHITSLPSPYGIGDIGPAAHEFLRVLHHAGQTCWQFLPLTPTSTFIGNSPYSSPSAFACNPLLISPEALVNDGFVSWADVDVAHPGDSERVDYARVEEHRTRVLRAAFARNRHRLAVDADYARFVATSSGWLEDYARFVTLKDAHGGALWTRWEDGYARRHPDALARWDAQAAEGMEYVRFEQYLFHRQWRELRREAKRLGVRLVGDAPIYVTYDSADVWANPEYFQLDDAFEPVLVAGVPPDYFSETGQRWGNPVYDWNALRSDGFRWWIGRLQRNFELADVVRIDHFRGFAGYWAIPAHEETAINGHWVDAPGMELFATLSRHFGHLPCIAEDLGVITPDVRELRDTYALPGMKILQFAFGGTPAENPDIPFRHVRRSVVYTGTHDNAPTRAWFETLPDSVRVQLADYAGHGVTAHNVANVLLRMALGSIAATCVVPLQDVLGLGEEARMNVPSVANGNWGWRMKPEHMDMARYNELARLTALYGRR